MTQQEKEQRLKEAADKYAIDNFGSAPHGLAAIGFFMAGAKSEAALEYWQSQQKQETPELEEIRKEWNEKHSSYVGNYKLSDYIFNFFAPYIKGTDAVEFAEWIKKEGWINKHPNWYRTDGWGILKTTDELYNEFKSLPKAPKEVGNG